MTFIFHNNLKVNLAKTKQNKTEQPEKFFLLQKICHLVV